MKRLKHIFFVGIRTLLPAIANFVISALVVHHYSSSLWGAFIEFFILINLFNQLTFWGHREVSLRFMSSNPKTAVEVWGESLMTRLPILLIPVLYYIFCSQSVSIICTLIGIQCIYFVQQSAQTLLTYNRRFSADFWSELFANGVYVLFVLFIIDELNVTMMLFCHLLYIISKLLLTLVVLRKDLRQFKFQFNVRHYRDGALFMLILLGGFLNSRVDILFLSGTSNDSIVGDYHIVSNYLLQGATVAAFLLIPISKYLYRLSREQYVKLIRKMTLFGLLTGLLASVAMPYILLYIYKISTPTINLISFLLFVLCSFVNLPIIYWFYRIKKEKMVLLMNYIGVIMHLLLLWFYSADLYLWNVLLIIVASKVTLTILYLVLFQRSKPSDL